MTIYLKDKDVARRYVVHRPTIWRWVRNDPSFPKPINLSPGCTRWKLEELEAWERAKASQQAA